MEKQKNSFVAVTKIDSRGVFFFFFIYFLRLKSRRAAAEVDTFL